VLIICPYLNHMGNPIHHNRKNHGKHQIDPDVIRVIE
jgi:hypothetical protein